jgi:hypothetical protein
MCIIPIFALPPLDILMVTPHLHMAMRCVVIGVWDVTPPLGRSGWVPQAHANPHVAQRPISFHSLCSGQCYPGFAMSDPLSIAASVAALLQLSATAIEYLKNVKQGASDRARLRDELRNTVCLLEMLRDRVEDSLDSEGGATGSPWISALAGQDGPLNLFKALLADIIEKLVPQDRLRKIAQPFRWPFSEKEITKTLEMLERLKTSFNLIIQDELLYVDPYSFAG